MNISEDRFSLLQLTISTLFQKSDRVKRTQQWICVATIGITVTAICTYMFLNMGDMLPKKTPGTTENGDNQQAGPAREPAPRQPEPNTYYLKEGVCFGYGDLVVVLGPVIQDTITVVWDGEGMSDDDYLRYQALRGRQFVTILYWYVNWDIRPLKRPDTSPFGEITIDCGWKLPPIDIHQRQPSGTAGDWPPGEMHYEGEQVEVFYPRYDFVASLYADNPPELWPQESSQVFRAFYEIPEYDSAISVQVGNATVILKERRK